MRLSPWAGLADHRPLGGINWLRKEVYAMSKKKRESLNAANTEEVMSVDDIP
jgi:hypothetical protein